MNAFMDAFFVIDKKHQGKITAEALDEYMKEKNYNPQFRVKWMKIFDSENTGVITLDNFCDVLGLEATKVLADRGLEKPESPVPPEVTVGPDGLPSDVTVISVDMSKEMQIKFCDYSGEALDKYDNPKDIVQYMKKTLEANHDKLWHCLLVEGEYYANYSYEPEMSFVFKRRRYIFLFFRTPYEF